MKAEPAMTAELTVSVPVPLEVSVTDCVVGVFRLMLPNERLLVLRVIAGTDALNCRPKLVEMPTAVAVRFTVCAEVTAETVAVKPVLVAFAGIVTEAGTVTAELLLARLTVIPLLGAVPFSETVQESDPAPVIEELVHKIPLRVARPVPLRLIVAVPPEEALLDIVSIPVAAPADVGSNCTCKVAL